MSEFASTDPAGPETIEQLWRNHHARLLNYARHHIDYDQAEDVVQTTYLKACEAMRRGAGYREDSSGWLFRIAHNLVIDLYRARDRTPDMLELDAPSKAARETLNETNGDVLPDEALALDRLVEQSETSEAVRKCIARLSRDQAFVMTALLDGYLYREICGMMQKSDGSVKSLRMRAIQQIRLAVDEEGTPVPAPSIAGYIKDVLRTLLQEHGPLTVGQMADYSGIPNGTIYGILRNCGGFCKLPKEGGGVLWDLAEAA